jgi:AcrR family transcriptional regulator
MKTELHATQRQLIDATVELLDSASYEELTAAMVLESTGIAKSSLYHFFKDFSDLLERALLERFRKSVAASAEVIKGIVERARTLEEFVVALDGVTAATQRRTNSGIRFERARILARSEKNDSFRAELGTIQQALTDSLAEAIQLGQEKGFLNRSFEARTIAVFIQAYTLGRAVDDTTTTHMNDEDWNALIGQILRRVLAN